MKILFFRAAKGTILDRIIALWTMGKYSHCEIELNGVCYSTSSQRGGVYQRNFNEDYTKNFDIIDLSALSPTFSDCSHYHKHYVKEFYQQTINSKYDWIGLIFNFLFSKEIENNKYYCSEWCSLVIRKTFDLHDSITVHGSPNKLYRDLTKLLVHFKNLN